MARVPGLIPFADDKPQPGQRITERRVPVDWDAGGIRQLPKLRPTAQPVDLYFRPPAELPADRPFNQLVDSLGQLNAALQRWGSVGMQERQNADAAEVQRQNLINDESPEGRQRFLQWVQQNPQRVSTAAAQEVIGRSRAITRAAEITREYETTFDRDNGNLEQFVTERMRQDLPEGANPVFIAAYNQRMQQFITQLRERHTRERGQRDVSTVEAGLTTIYRDAIEGAPEGATGQQIVDAIRQRRDADQRYTRISYQRQDELFLAAVEQVARTRGNINLVNQLLATRRVFRHSDGREQELPTWETAFPQQVNRIREVAGGIDRQNTERTNVDRRVQIEERISRGEGLTDEDQAWLRRQLIPAMPGQRAPMTDEQVTSYIRRANEAQQREALRARTGVIRQRLDEDNENEYRRRDQQTIDDISNGRVGNIRTAVVVQRSINERGEITTTETEVTPEQQITRARDVVQRTADARIAQAQAALEQARNSPAEGRESRVTAAQENLNRATEQSFNELGMFASRTGQANEPWQRIIRQGAMAANSVTMTQGQNAEPSPEMMAGFALYQQIRTRFPNLLERHTDERSRALYERASEIMLHSGVTAQVALREAFFRGQEQQARGDREARPVDFVTELRGLNMGSTSTDGIWRQMFGRGANPTDPIAIRAMEQFYTQFRQNGLNRDEALSAAGRRFRETHRVVNGYAVNTSDMTPQDADWFTRAAEAYIRTYVDHDRTDRVEMGDVVLRRREGSQEFFLVNRSGMNLGDVNRPQGMAPAFSLDHLRRFMAERERQRDNDSANEINQRQQLRVNPMPWNGGVVPPELPNQTPAPQETTPNRPVIEVPAPWSRQRRQ